MLAKQRFAADSAPHVYYLFQSGRSRLRLQRVFYGMGDSEWKTTKSGRACLSIEATWKVWWPDAYEWNGSRFVYANLRHPENYAKYRDSELSKDDRHDYPYLLRLACAAAIRGERKRTLNLLKKAEYACLKCMTRNPAGRNPAESSYYDSGFFGETSENLKQIRQRIRWVQRDDLNHPLLYRPYDWDLQVPPYRLGKAKPTWR